jgi:hypothetical protein
MKNLSKNIIYLFLIFYILIICTSYKFFKNDCICNKYKVAFNFILNDSATNIFFKTQLAEKNIKPFVSKQIIPFNLKSIGFDVIKKNYIHDFSQNLLLNNSEIIKLVSDSLSRLDLEINSDYTKEDSLRCDLFFSKKDNSNFFIFFSKEYNNLIYAELWLKNSYDSDLQFSYGETLTYLFVFNDSNKIIKYYDGQIFNN